MICHSRPYHHDALDRVVVEGDQGGPSDGGKSTNIRSQFAQSRTCQRRFVWSTCPGVLTLQTTSTVGYQR